MATRKQKHQQALEKRARFLAEIEQTNAENLRRTNEHRERKNRESWQPKHEKSHSWKKVEKDCPFCQDLLANQKHQQRQLESADHG